MNRMFVDMRDIGAMTTSQRGPRLYVGANIYCFLTFAASQRHGLAYTLEDFDFDR